MKLKLSSSPTEFDFKLGLSLAIADLVNALFYFSANLRSGHAVFYEFYESTAINRHLIKTSSATDRWPAPWRQHSILTFNHIFQFYYNFICANVGIIS